MKHVSDFPLKCVSFVHCNIVQYIMHFIRAKHLDHHSSYQNILQCITLRAVISMYSCFTIKILFVLNVFLYIEVDSMSMLQIGLICLFIRTIIINLLSAC